MNDAFSLKSLLVLTVVGCMACGGRVEEPGAEAEEAVASTPARAAAHEFAQDAVNWMTTIEGRGVDGGIDAIALGGSQGDGYVAIRNGMRNAMSWTKGDTRHQLQAASNLSMCMSAYVLAQAYPHLASQQGVIQSNLQYLQRAVLATQDGDATSLSQFGFPASPKVNQYSAKTNSLCGLAFLELYGFWGWRATHATSAQEATTLRLYAQDAKSAALSVRIFLERLQDVKTLPGMPVSKLNLSTLKDANGDGHFDGLFDEIRGGKLVMSTALWSAMAGRFFAELADARVALGLSVSEANDLKHRAEGMKAFYGTGLGLAGEHYSPRFTCSASTCAGKLTDSGLGIAFVENFVSGESGVSGGDDQWHGRVTGAGGQHENLDGSDSPQWALNALYSIDASATNRAKSHFDDYWSASAPQANKVGAGVYQLLSSGRDIFLGLGTYVLHGRPTADGHFVLADDAQSFAHLVESGGKSQIVTSYYGDDAVSGWAPTEWAHANEELFHEYKLSAADASLDVRMPGDYDFGSLSHLAHWAMSEDSAGNLRPLVNDKMTVAAENMASTLCRALRVWQGRDACTL